MLLRLVFVLFYLFCETTASSCPYGSVVDSNASCIHVEATRMDWPSAEAWCVARGGHLVSIHNQFDNTFLQELGLNVSNYCSNIWTGGLTYNYSVSWSDGTPFDYSFWANGEPNGNSYTYYIYLEINTGFWRTYVSSSTYCFACEIPQEMTDCADWYKAGYKDNGAYKISLNGTSHDVYCSMDNGGGWTVFQNRMIGDESFWDRTWDDYKDGFNTERLTDNSNFWLGSELLHQLTAKDKDVTLRVEMMGDRTPGSSKASSSWFNEYTRFKVAGESSKYQLTDLYVDNKGQGNSMWNALMYSVGAEFSTIDRVNDPELDCAWKFKMGGWWLRNCALTSLNGDYDFAEANGYGMFWTMSGINDIIHPISSRMMLRPTSFST
ncbi:unnamed protein product [Cylicocyclus nassatus]|uniref:Uncharacterized protein n=1 Tax=Cylicocyclus nassatus TaxID=53992 RepID=A0AA36GKL0_CYLNA|nr:unnamed protein product [Cylicocyclus nassatus]